MADLLIAIGGTGQHTALAVARMVFLGALPPMTLAVIDSDDSQELSLTLKTFGRTVDEEFALHPLDNGARIYPPFNKGARVDPEFEELFLKQNSTSLERDIFELCFDETSASVAVADGMFGRPSVGATIFAQNKDEELREVFDKARTTQDMNIFVTGSMVGGTGAGIIHQLVKALPRDRRVYAVLFLRWFNAATGGQGQPVTDSTMDRNMRYGLDYFFKDTRPLLKGAMLIGMPDEMPMGLRRVTVNAQQPGEQKHFFHLMAAYGIAKLPVIAVTQDQPGVIYGSMFDEPAAMYDERWGDGDSSHPLSWYVNRALFVKEILDYATSPEYVSQVSATLRGLTRLLATAPANVGLGLHKTIKQYERAERQTRFEEVVKTWKALSRQYEFSLSWLEEILGRFPVEKYAPRYREARENPTAKVKEIQTLWREEIPEGQRRLTAPEVARVFHQRIVDDFKER